MTKRGKSEDKDSPTWEEIAAVALKHLQIREAKPRKPNDPTYHRREAEKTAVAALVACCEQKEPPPRAVVELVAHLLRLPPESSMINQKRDEYYQAAEYLALNRDASNRQVADAVGVSKDTIRQWKTEDKFIGYRAHYMLRHSLGMGADEYAEFMSNVASE
jgi:hypothetical protein